LSFIGHLKVVACVTQMYHLVKWGYDYDVWLLTMEASQCGVCGGQSGTGTSFFLCSSVFCC